MDNRSTLHYSGLVWRQGASCCQHVN